MAGETSSDPIGNVAGKPAAEITQRPEPATGGEGGAPKAEPRPGASTMSGAPEDAVRPESTASGGTPPEGVPSEAQLAAEDSDDPELGRQGADVQTEPL